MSNCKTIWKQHIYYKENNKRVILQLPLITPKFFNVTDIENIESFMRSPLLEHVAISDFSFFTPHSSMVLEAVATKNCHTTLNASSQISRSSGTCACRYLKSFQHLSINHQK